MRALLITVAGLILLGCSTRATDSAFPGIVAQCDRRAADSLVTALRTQESDEAEPKLLQPGRQRYPSKFYTRGIGGRVEFEFVVQADGSVDPCTIRALSYTNEGFVLPGSEMIAASQFAVPMRNGVPTPVLMRQALNWRVAD